jgi:hypothetical protein
MFVVSQSIMESSVKGSTQKLPVSASAKSWLVWDFPAAAATSLEFSYTWYSECQCNKIVWATKTNVTVEKKKSAPKVEARP